MSAVKEDMSTIDVIFAVVSVCSAIPGILGNTCILRVFYDERRLLSRKIFILIAVTDVIISISSAIPFGISRFFHRKPILFANKIFCNMTGVVFNISSRLSIFLISVLSFTRCLAIMNPIRVIRSNITMYCVGGVQHNDNNNIMHTLHPLHNPSIQRRRKNNDFYTNTSEYTPAVIGSWTLLLIQVHGCTTSWNIYYSSSPSSCLLLLSSPAVFSASSPFHKEVSTEDQHRDPNNRNPGNYNGIRPVNPRNSCPGTRKKAKVRATMTILIMTLTFVVLNFPHWVLLFLFFLERNISVSIVNYQNPWIIWLYIFCTNVSQYMNAGINPIIYITRVTEAQKRIKNRWTVMLAWFRVKRPLPQHNLEPNSIRNTFCTRNVSVRSTDQHACCQITLA